NGRLNCRDAPCVRESKALAGRRMTKLTKILASLMAAVLSVFVLWAGFDRASAGEPTSAAPSAAAAPEGATKPRGRAYLFRGFAGMVFSRGTDQLAERIERAGFMATVNEAMMCPNIVKEAIRDYRRAPAPIILIGHSVGGACALSFAESLLEENIAVGLIVTTEPARVSRNVPLNVQRYINIYQSNTLLPGHDLITQKAF